MPKCFLHPLGQVSFDVYRPEDVGAALESAEAKAWRTTDAVLAIAAEERSYDNTVVALAEAAEHLGWVSKLTDHVARALGGPWHPVNERAAERYGRFRDELRYNTAAYEALRTVQERLGAGLSSPQRKYLRDRLTAYERDGIALDGPRQEELKSPFGRLSAAQVSFRRNVRPLANLAGYRDYADYALVPRMAKNGLTAAEFVAHRADAYRQLAGAEHQR